jgi:hypothetical protein
LTIPTSNNVLRRHLAALPLSPGLLSDIVNNPVAFAVTLDPATAKVVVDGYRRGFRTVFIVCSSLAAAAFFITLFLMPQKTLRRVDDEQRKIEAQEYLEERRREKLRNNVKVSGSGD